MMMMSVWYGGVVMHTLIVNGDLTLGHLGLNRNNPPPLAMNFLYESVSRIGKIVKPDMIW